MFAQPILVRLVALLHEADDPRRVDQDAEGSSERPIAIGARHAVARIAHYWHRQPEARRQSTRHRFCRTEDRPARNNDKHVEAGLPPAIGRAYIPQLLPTCPAPWAAG